jgi:hypothetical protein
MTTTQKFRVLGVEQGITITRPFNREMHDHNDNVREMQNKAVIGALLKLKDSEDEELIEKATKSCSGYGYGDGYDHIDMIEDAIQNVETSANNWMKDEIWPDFVRFGLVQPLDTDYVGYKKLETLHAMFHTREAPSGAFAVLDRIFR